MENRENFCCSNNIACKVSPKKSKLFGCITYRSGSLFLFGQSQLQGEICLIDSNQQKH